MNRRRFKRTSFAAIILVAAAAAGASVVQPSLSLLPTTDERDPGPSPTLGAPPPGLDARTIVLFDGTSWDQWTDRHGEPSGWRVLEDGSVEVVPRTGDARTIEEFGDFHLHLEFRLPHLPEARGQARANSGVYLHGRYEVQVLDSFGIDPPGAGDCGAIYGIAPPLVNACRPPETWQTYDIVFRAPRFDEAGQLTENPRITVLHNGILIQNNVEVPRPTGAAMHSDMTPRGPIVLQDHGNRVRYRNIWITPTD